MTLSISESVFSFIKKHGRQLLYEVSPVEVLFYLRYRSDPSSRSCVQYAKGRFRNILDQKYKRIYREKIQTADKTEDDRSWKSQAPKARNVEKHSHPCITSGAENSYDGNIGNVSKGHFQAKDEKKAHSRVFCFFREGKKRKNGTAQKDNEASDTKAYRRNKQNEAFCIGVSSIEFFFADVFADHNTAGIAKTDDQYEGDVFHRSRDGKRGNIAFSHSSVNHTSLH